MTSIATIKFLQWFILSSLFDLTHHSITKLFVCVLFIIVDLSAFDVNIYTIFSINITHPFLYFYSLMRQFFKLVKIGNSIVDVEVVYVSIELPYIIKILDTPLHISQPVQVHPEKLLDYFFLLITTLVAIFIPFEHNTF